MVMLDVFRGLSAVLTPNSNALFSFLIQSVMYSSPSCRRGRTKIPLDFDSFDDVVDNRVAIGSNVLISDDPEMEDLDRLSVCFMTVDSNDDYEGLEFYSDSYDIATEIDDYEYTYWVDLESKTFTLKTRAEYSSSAV